MAALQLNAPENVIHKQAGKEEGRCAERSDTNLRGAAVWQFWQWQACGRHVAGGIMQIQIERTRTSCRMSVAIRQAMRLFSDLHACMGQGIA